MLQTDPQSIKSASNDYGNLVQENPFAVLYPSSIQDIINLIQFSNNCSTPFTVSARGRGHSVRGQAMARGGVVVDMAALSENINGNGIRVSWSPSIGYYADVGGEQMWIDVLRAGLEHGLSPVSWTDYLYLSVGGTLSNAGISGQSFLYGPQISNAKWVRLLYSDFSMFTRDQEHLISIDINGPNYVEGSLITDHSPPNNWRSSFYSPSDQSKIHSLLQSKQGLLYSIEVVKYYDHHNTDTIDQAHLNFIPGFVFKKDVPLLDFLNRVGSRENQNSEDQLEAHPWLNLFVPKSQIMDFNDGVFVNMIRRHNHTSGPILFYPFHRQKWDDRMSAVIPDEEIFYTLGLLPSRVRGRTVVAERTKRCKAVRARTLDNDRNCMRAQVCADAHGDKFERDKFGGEIMWHLLA
ncbi:hypothetical protein DH2020_014588 [Rehmannia glutinosa]|uniref:FAD-binding PCMH-type domain-containing protein n=1 Tax=Rehmannia glutinosa TaxID=99300 RepID=A0ABR0WYC6_REHGL